MGGSFVAETAHKPAAPRLRYGKLPDSLPELAEQPPNPGALRGSIVSHVQITRAGTSGAVVLLMICRKQGEPMRCA